MLLPRNLMSGVYEKPRCFLCETNKEKICQLETTNMSGTFKFNSYSTLNFDVARVYNDLITGETKPNPYYNKLEALRLAYVEGFGYFELQDPEIESDGIKEFKSLTAYSLEYTLTQKYLESLYVNTGEIDSVEVMYAEEHNDGVVIPVTLYNPNIPELSLLHIILEKIYGWKIAHVDKSLQTMSRQFEVDRESVYDFIMNEICDKFNCYAVFDTVNNEMSFYAEALTNKFTGDGTTNTFTISPVFTELGTVSIDGYKTINYTYDNTTGVLTLGDTPVAGAMIEVTDGALSSWETDVYVSFENLAQQMNISYSSDDIKTVLTVKGSDDLDIREVNNGLPYIVDLSYFYDPEKSWMGEELHDAYTEYLAKCNQYQAEYKANSQNIIETSSRISYETNRLSLRYSEVSVAPDTVGTYYVRGGNADAGYYYTEVSLPSDYIAGTTYYSVHTTDLNESKVSALYEALKTYYSTKEVTDFTSEESTLIDDFSFMEKHTLENLIDTLDSEEITDEDKDAAVLDFFNEMWEQLGLTPLETLYLEPYKQVQTVNVSAGWAQEDNANYGLYYPVVLILESLEHAIGKRQATIDTLTEAMEQYSARNIEIGNELLIDNNFSDDQMIRLSAFLREDEYTDDNFVVTGNESTEELFKLKQELLECGRIELSKLCEPCLKFSMSLANIYALPEFAPIVNQFQLGNLIKVALRPDYVKHARLMEVNLNFEDFSDFSCTFGDLTSIRSQTDLHADLLSQAVSAGKTVASNASYWNKGSDQATSTDLKIQSGLLDAVNSIKSMDGTQGVDISKYGIRLQSVDPVTGAVDPRQTWMVNNKILMSSDGFKTARTGLGEFHVNGQDQYGFMADFMMAGYIEGSTMVGGTIQIGEREDGTYNFEVDENGYITMIGGKGVSSNGDAINLDDYNTTIEVTADRTALSSSSSSTTLTCKIYSYGIDVTDTYDGSVFHWLRSTEDNVADEEWNATQDAVAQGNTFVVTANDVQNIAFFQCKVDLISGNSKCSNSVAITIGNANIHIFSAKPSVVLEDGYCYHTGDLWVIGYDYQPASYLQNNILVAIADGVSYSDADWVESVEYSKTYNDLQEWQGVMQEHVQVLDDGLHLIGPTSDGVSFESVLQSKQLTFRSKQGENEQDVVWLGVDNMTAREVTAINYIDVQSESDETLPYIKLGNFVLQIEDNGSLSVV